MKKTTALLFILLLFFQCKTPQIATQNPNQPIDFKTQPVRGVWLTNVVSDALFSKKNLNAAVKKCADYGINSIFVVVWNRGRTLYPSKVMKNLIGIELDEKLKGRDILQETIDAARRHNIKVYAWFEFGFSCDIEEKPGVIEGKEILEKKPHWAAIDKNGQIVKKNGFRWLNGFDSEVQDFMLSLMVECVKNYPELAGVQGDDRLPALPSEAGYDPLSISRFSNENEGVMPSADPKEPRWLDWKAAKMNDFMRRIHDTLKSVKPTTVISMSPSIFPWSKDEYLQDWPTWVKNGWVDMVCPQVYRYNLEAYSKEIGKIVKEQVPKEHQHKIFPGILLRVGDYYAKPDVLEKMLEANRAAGLSGEVFFYYEGFKPHDAFFRKKYRK